MTFKGRICLKDALPICTSKTSGKVVFVEGKGNRGLFAAIYPKSRCIMPSSGTVNHKLAIDGSLATLPLCVEKDHIHVQSMVHADLVRSVVQKDLQAKLGVIGQAFNRASEHFLMRKKTPISFNRSESFRIGKPSGTINCASKYFSGVRISITNPSGHFNGCDWTSGRIAFFPSIELKHEIIRITLTERFGVSMKPKTIVFLKNFLERSDKRGVLFHNDIQLSEQAF